MRAWLLLGVLAGCAGADAMTTQVGPVAATTDAQAGLGLHPGETMAFEVHLAGVLAGEAQLAVGELGEHQGREVIVVKSRAATAGVAAVLKKISDEATTIIDTATGKPLSIESHLTNGDRQMTASAVFHDKRADITFQRTQATDKPDAKTTDAKPRTVTLNYGDLAVFDAHTAMAQLRGWKGAVGAQRSVYLVGGRRLWRVDVTRSPDETIGSEQLGNRRALVYAGKSFRAKPTGALDADKPTRTFTVWLSDDADRVPLKVVAATELGDIVMNLTDYARP